MSDFGKAGGRAPAYEKPPSDQNVIPGGADEPTPKNKAGQEIGHYEPLGGYARGGTVPR